jgi:hypothetical protein
MVAALGEFGTEKTTTQNIPLLPMLQYFLLCVLSVLKHTFSFVSIFRVLCDGKYGFLFLFSQTIIVRNLEQLILLP